MQRRSVDLPLPDAPMRQTTSCSATVRSMPAQDLQLAERLVEALDPDGRRGPVPELRSARHRASPAS